MNAKPGLKGRDLLLDTMERLRRLDPRTAPFDGEEVRDIESAVAVAVQQVFGDDSWEEGEYGVFRIAAGHMGLSDTRSDKQAKLQAGHPRAVERLEEILEVMDRHLAAVPEVLELEPEEARRPPQSPRPSQKPQESKPPAPIATPASPPRPPSPSPAPPQPKPAAPVQEPKAPKPSQGPSTRSTQPGSVLLLREGGDETFLSVTALLDKLAVDVTIPQGEHEAADAQILASCQGAWLAIMAACPAPKGGLTGITSVIGKARPRHEVVYRLGLLAGRLGAGRVAVLYSGEKPLDIPHDLHGVQYIPYKGEGGWQITLVRFLKAAGFMVDANMLFD